MREGWRKGGREGGGREGHMLSRGAFTSLMDT